MKSKKPKKQAVAVKPRVLAVRFTQAQFMSLSPPERELLIRIGLAQNDLLLMQRLWGALYYRKPKSQLAHEVQAVHTIALLLILLGKLFEAMLIFKARFLSQPLAREYLPLFKPAQKDAVQRLRRLLGRNTLLAKIRNEYAFHYHDADLSGFMSDWHGNRPLSIYFGDPDANSLNLFAVEPFVVSLMALTGTITPDAALRFVQREAALPAITAFSSFVAAVQLVAIKRMLGKTPVLEECEILPDEFLPHDKFVIPFLMGVATNYLPKVAGGK